MHERVAELGRASIQLQIGNGMLRGEIGGDSLNLPLSFAGMSYFSSAALFRF
jgi:hypothetical protein